MELQWLWNAYCDLTMTRQAGMIANPIMMSEIEAYGRLMNVQLTPWELRTLLTLDQVLLARAAPGKAGAQAEVDVRDGAGVSALMKGLGAKMKGKK